MTQHDGRLRVVHADMCTEHALAIGEASEMRNARRGGACACQDNMSHKPPKTTPHGSHGHGVPVDWEHVVMACCLLFVFVFMWLQ
jgi:hypothetical protein